MTVGKTMIVNHGAVGAHDRREDKKRNLFHVIQCLYVSQIDMSDAFFQGDTLGGAERGEGRWRRVEEAVAGEEAGEVEWGVGQLVVDEPSAHFADHIGVVVDIGDDEVGELDPHTGIAHGEDGVEHGLQMAAADALVDGVAEGFQVDVGGIEVGQKVAQGLLTDVARGDEDVPETCLMGQTGAVGDVFEVGEGFGVGVGDARTVVLLAEGHEDLGCDVVMVNVGR